MITDEARPVRGTATDHNGRLTNTEAPKGTDLNVCGREALEHVAQELSARPRKRLEPRKPIERIEGLLLQ
jgi:IS30 family transposase